MQTNRVALSLLLILSSCAFSNDSNKQTIDRQYGSLIAKFDWNNGKNPRPDYLVKAKRFQRMIGEREVTAESVVTVPVKIPNPLTIITSLPKEAKDGFRFARATAKLKGEEKILSIDAQRVEAGLRFNVEALASVFSQAESQIINLKIEVFGEAEKLFTFNYQLRTPPSELSLKAYDVLSAKESIAPMLTTGIMAPEIEGQRFGLIQVLSIHNEEDTPVEILYPKKVKGSLVQNTTQFHYQDLGCGSGGQEFSHYPVDHQRLITRALYVVPLDQGLLISLGEAKSEDTPTLTSSYLIPEKSEKLFGVYAASGDTKAWVERGGISDQTYQKILNSTCYWDCADINMSREKPSGFCNNYGRHQSSFKMGTSFGSSTLQIQDEPWAARFLDLDQLMEDGYREKVLLKGSFPVTYQKMEI